MSKFKKCPRCGLNYIPVSDELCAICVKETAGVREERYCCSCGKILEDDEEEYCAECADFEASAKDDD